MKAEGGMQNAEAAAPSAGSAEQAASSKAHRLTANQRAMWVLALHVGEPACVCRSSGIIGRGPLTCDALGQFAAGAASFCARQAMSITVEPDVITIHVGAIA
jgi:hypothetical protein